MPCKRPPELQNRVQTIRAGTAARTRKSRDERSAIGAVRVDFSLDPDSAAKLGQLIELWHCPNRKEAIQQAIQIAHMSAYGENKRKG